MVLALAPFLYLLSMVARYRIDIPYLDQWEFVPMLAKSYDGTLTLRDFWAQHQEHRLLFPRLVMVALAHWSGWNITYELATSILLAVGIFAVLVHQIRVTAKSVGDRHVGWIIPVVSLLVFSMNQRLNWFWGWQIQILMSVFAAVAGIILLTALVLTWRRFLMAVLLGIVATYSFANGLLFWFIGLPILLVVPHTHKRTFQSPVVLWIVIGLLVFGSYLYDYHTPAIHPDVLFFLEEPVEYVKYVLIFLGAPLGLFARKYAMIASTLGLILLCYASWVLIRFRKMNPRLLVPYFALSTYAIGSGLMVGVGRAGLGTMQALTSRYVTISSPLWISIVVLLYLLISGGSRFDKSVRMLPRVVALISICLIVLGVIYDSALNSSIAIRDHRGSPTMLRALLSAPDDDTLKLLYHNPRVVREGLKVLEKYRLSIFRDTIR